MALDSLTAHDKTILDIERRFWATPGGKEIVIVDELGISPVRYYQKLNQLIETEAALAHDPITVNRLRRVRSANAHDVAWQTCGEDNPQSRARASTSKFRSGYILAAGRDLHPSGVREHSRRYPAYLGPSPLPWEMGTGGGGSS